MRIENVMNRHKQILLVILLFAPMVAKAGLVQFDTEPSGGTLVPVAPGITVGWGYRFDVTLDVNEVFMAVGVSDTGFPLGSGTASSAVFDYPIYYSSGVYTMPWVAGTSGLYEFAWDAGAWGDTVNGTFTLMGQLWDGDPFGSGTMLQEFPLDTPFSASTEAEQVPEPSTGLMLGFAITGIWWLRRRRPSAPTS